MLREVAKFHGELRYDVGREWNVGPSVKRCEGQGSSGNAGMCALG